MNKKLKPFLPNGDPNFDGFLREIKEFRKSIKNVKYVDESVIKIINSINQKLHSVINKRKK